jgi:hypothetical protein
MEIAFGRFQRHTSYLTAQPSSIERHAKCCTGEGHFKRHFCVRCRCFISPNEHLT